MTDLKELLRTMDPDQVRLMLDEIEAEQEERAKEAQRATELEEMREIFVGAALDYCAALGIIDDVEDTEDLYEGLLESMKQYEKSFKSMFDMRRALAMPFPRIKSHTFAVGNQDKEALAKFLDAMGIKESK